MPAKQMLIDVTEPLEEVARAVPGAVDVVSTTSRGSAQIFVDFPWGSDMRRGATAGGQRLRTEPAGPAARHDLRCHPDEPERDHAVRVLRADLGEGAVGGSAPLAQYQIAPLLTGIAGVRRVGVTGGETPEVQVSLSGPPPSCTT